METTLNIFGWNIGAILIMMVGGWSLSLVHRNVTIVDSLWGLGFVVISWITLYLSEGYLIRQTLISILVTLWGVRLIIYLTWRNWGTGEDPRYGAMREKSGDKFWIVSLFKVFLLQGVFMFVISLAFFYSIALLACATVVPD